ncbi:AFG1 family ATPase [Corallincola holothuriorum]|uniref:Cell division protein ZapE n=1 Tax=Corallincola holothuriorum TaxID=2282215 RepID=A0A368NJC2_9GAMM|nr:cell division protein ZapE [Corallincola holothuriorum]RCU49865.1 AFG1 family ATPase [Corallincola holothuriorum]
MSDTPLARYEKALEQSGFVRDSAQANAVNHLQELYQRLSQPPQRSFWQRLTKAPTSTAKGLYFWGGVGRGKTYLVDTFFECLPAENKLRLHFHRFMHRVHQMMQALSGQSDPLDSVAEQLAAEARVICLDEFFVSDITDAMILGNLLKGLFLRGVTLVTTSNIPPDELYRNGLQRARFLPAIALLNQHCDIVNVDSGIDYRLRTLERAEIYHHPLDAAALVNLEQYFAALAPEPGKAGATIEVNNRQLVTRWLADGVVMFDFAVLCESARSQIDYIELSKEFHTLLLHGVKQMGVHNDDVARRFIALVDEFYERNVKLIISAEREMEKLYDDGRLSFEFKRCQSRLLEMQSHEYLKRPHIP